MNSNNADREVTEPRSADEVHFLHEEIKGMASACEAVQIHGIACYARVFHMIQRGDDLSQN